MKSGFDISKLPKCLAHGPYVGKECPKCHLASDGLSTTEPIAPAIEYDRSKWHRGPEKELHDWLETWCGRHGVSFIHSRMDKESTIRKGWPDFTLIYTAADGITRACLIEFKSKNTPILKDQVEVGDELRERRIPVLVTGNYDEAVEFVKTHLNLNP